MLDRLDAALTSQRRLLDDVRHELKTPITIVRGHLELLDSEDPRDVEATRLIAIDELDRMSGLIDEIEVLAESRMLVTRRALVHAGELAAEVVRQVPRHPRPHLARRRSAPNVARLGRSREDRAGLAAARRQRGRSTRRGGSIDHHRVDDFEGAVEFWVQDSGPGIPPGAELTIFDRHARGDDGDAPGSGLGLRSSSPSSPPTRGRVAVASTATGTRIGFVIPAQPAAARVGVPA